MVVDFLLAVSPLRGPPAVGGTYGEQVRGPDDQETKISSAATPGKPGRPTGPPGPGRGTGPAVTGRRQWLAAAAVLAVAAVLVPPLATLARRYVFVESIQFTIFAMVAPALIVLGAPWRLLRLSSPGTAAGGPGDLARPAAPSGRGGGPLDRLAAVRERARSFPRAAAYLVAFMGACLLWRLPPVIDALARHPLLLPGELLTLLAAGTGLWLELAGSAPLAPRLPNPHRAAVAALAMWSTWAVAYALGFAGHAVFRGYDPAGSALSTVADQQIAVGLVWAISAFAFMPVVFVTMLTWLSGNDNPDEELQRLARDDQHRAVVRGWDRRPRTLRTRRAPSPPGASQPPRP